MALPDAESAAGCDRRIDFTFCMRAGLSIRRAKPSALAVKLAPDNDCAKLGVAEVAALIGLADALDGVETNDIVDFRGLVGSFVSVDTEDTAIFVGLADLCILEDFVGLIKRERVDCGRAMAREAVGVAADLGLLVDVSSSLRCLIRFSGCRSAGARSAALLGEENW